MSTVQSLTPSLKKDGKYPLWGIIAALALNYLSPFVSPLLVYPAFLICLVRVVRYDERVFATDCCALISVTLLFRMNSGMSLLVYLYLFADVWYFIRGGVKANSVYVLAILLLNYFLLRMQFNFSDFLLCFGQLLLMCVLLPKQDAESAERSAKVFCVALVVASCYALVFRNSWQIVRLRGDEDPAFWGSSIIRFYGLYRDPNYYSMLLITGMGLLLKLRDSKRIRLLPFWILLLAMVAFGALTVSKTFFVLLVLLVCMYLVWQFWNKRVIRGVLMTTCVVLVGVTILTAEDSIFAVVLERFANATNMDELTTGRSELAMMYFKVITESVPSALFGQGMAAKNLGIDPHNLYLEIAYYLGAVGLVLVILYYAAVIAVVRRQNEQIRQQNFMAKYIVLFVSMLAHVTLHGMTTFPTYFVFFAAGLSLIIVKKPADEEQVDEEQ